MTGNLVIRPVRLEEAPLLKEIGATTFRETFAAQNTEENLSAYLQKSFDLANVKEQLVSSVSEFYFVEKGGEIYGYLKLNTSKKGLEIERIYVRQTAQGTGIGKAMFEFSLGLAKTRKSEWLWLGVWQENIKAVEFYKRQGMEIFDVRQFQLGNELQDDFLMRMRVD
ncbi:GNAT family N-acetyltransferase [Roseivirga sp. E12]|uniref:GNAT family N-acetyltransferase n=1 Tax=Roseivirga sp. E12 TaxID=2819237 RepID=UPI001ABBE4A6|nr:GNAT family N-acetyltransferase [Roseivirga sp. E12]MBO3698260.1 GNAT family N-acetyltransferase [Roseivirga sp. E12]